MCPLPGWASSGVIPLCPGRGAALLRCSAALGHEISYAMNMRAAEAIVSNAPNAMKTFPISEVWSQVELSLPEARTGAAEAGLAWAIATVCLDGGACCSALSTSLSWSEATTCASAGACASAGLSAAASSMVLAFAVIALALSLALSAGASAAVSCALALATEAGIAVGVSPAALATSVLVVSAAVDGTLPGLRCPSRFNCRVVGLTDFADAALSDFEVGSAPAAIICDGPAKHTNSPVASINAERPLALIIMWQSPHLPAPK